MRFLTLEEQEYAVGLPKKPLLHASQTMMTTTDTMEMKENNVFEEGSVVSNLPLLFANGHPTSLEKITLTQLERFVTFMVQCSLGHDTTDEITEPRWWPKEVKFANPLTRPKRINENWMANLKKLVFRCYTYHRSEYLLRFCSYLARYPHEDLEYVNNWDSTTSLYHKSTGKLLVTFRNENMNYDKRHESPRKKLLSSNGVASCNSNKLKLQQQQHSILMVEPPAEDIYLCDNCDAEFIGLEKMKEHERMCCEQEQTGNNSRSTTPDVLITKPELKQDQFLEYFRLRSPTANATTAEVHEGASKNNNIAERSSRRVRGSINFARCSSIPFSSPAGMLLAKKSKAMTEDTQQERLERIERHLVAPVLNSSCRPKWLEAEFDNDRWIVTYKPNKEKVVDDYVHQYQFVNTVKRKPMLSIHSQLLYLACRPVYVLLTQLTQEQISEFNQNPLKNKSVERKLSIDDLESTTETVENILPSVSSKRKAPSDEIDLNSMEKDYDVALSSEASVGNLSLSRVTDCCGENKLTIDQPIKETTFCTNTPNRITVIDLCSSDDEENSITSALSDENRNPLKFITDDDVTKSLLQNLSSAKFYLPTRSTDQISGWPNGNILNDGNETCTSKYLSTMLSTRTNISPILRPAP
ncbi:ovaries absent isoform X1 [Lasioglossum baleicum]|uniref:ovaries absent isoform X1 n=1 Tax=Lasioglossum baleicum TaxID=434251 RepID=UPI003FCCA40B